MMWPTPHELEIPWARAGKLVEACLSISICYGLAPKRERSCVGKVKFIFCETCKHLVAVLGLSLDHPSSERCLGGFVD